MPTRQSTAPSRIERCLSKGRCAEALSQQLFHASPIVTDVVRSTVAHVEHGEVTEVIALYIEVGGDVEPSIAVPNEEGSRKVMEVSVLDRPPPVGRVHPLRVPARRSQHNGEHAHGTSLPHHGSHATTCRWASVRDERVRGCSMNARRRP
jgi:hypothetical protein